MAVSSPGARPNPPPINTGSSFFQRLGYYSTGIAIGLFMLGLLTIARQRNRPPPTAPPNQSAPGNPAPAPSTNR